MKGVCGGKGVTTKALLTERQKGEWNPDWTEPTRVVRRCRRWKPLDWFKCPEWSAFWTVLKWYVRQWKSQLQRVVLVMVVFNCFSPYFPVFCRSMKIKKTCLLWRECETNQCQKKQSLECCWLDVDAWMVYKNPSLLSPKFLCTSVYMYKVWLWMSNG